MSLKLLLLTDCLNYFETFKIDACLDCGIPSTLLSTNQILLERRNDNDIQKPIDLGDANSPDAPWMNDKK